MCYKENIWYVYILRQMTSLLKSKNVPIQNSKFSFNIFMHLITKQIERWF